MKRKYAGIILAIFMVAFIVTFPMIGCKRVTVTPAATVETTAPETTVAPETTTETTAAPTSSS